MAQGKLKIKSKVPQKSKKSGASKAKNKHYHGVKKGKKIIPPKKQQQQVRKFNKDIQKSIRRNIEAELSQKAKKVEEGRGFHFVGKSGSSSSS